MFYVTPRNFLLSKFQRGTFHFKENCAHILVLRWIPINANQCSLYRNNERKENIKQSTVTFKAR